jgi:hypothetical protein
LREKSQIGVDTLFMVVCQVEQQLLEGYGPHWMKPNRTHVWWVRFSTVSFIESTLSNSMPRTKSAANIKLIGRWPKEIMKYVFVEYDN